MEQVFEDKIRFYLQQTLREKDLIDERIPECPDVEEKWQEIAQAYLPDGMREYADYPFVSLGWMMFLGMALAQYWDEDWEKYGSQEQLYEAIRGKLGYDRMDEYILQEILGLDEKTRQETNLVVIRCASGVDSILHHESIEPGTPDAFRAYVACLHQMYLMGMAWQLKRMGYRMIRNGE